MDSIMIREVDCKDIENLSSSVKSPNDAAELISKIERVIKSRINSILILAYHQDVILRGSRKIACLRVQLPVLK